MHVFFPLFGCEVLLETCVCNQCFFSRGSLLFIRWCRRFRNVSLCRECCINIIRYVPLPLFEGARVFSIKRQTNASPL